MAHFTTFSAMEAVRDALEDGVDSQETRERLVEADAAWYVVMQEIAESNSLQSGRPDSMFDLEEVVSLSESTLPGLIGLAERYGRCGFVVE